MSEQQTATAAQATSACPHPEAVGKRWGDPISTERQAELQGYLDRWEAETDHGERKGPFAIEEPDESGVLLTGADVFWLAQRAEQGQHRAVPRLHLEGTDLKGAHLERASLIEAHLEGADLREAHLENAGLVGAQLKDAYLRHAHLRGAHLSGARLEGASLNEARMGGADLSGAHLEDASLNEAWLERADLREAHLEDARLSFAHLGGANLGWAHLQGANLSGAHLEGASLSFAQLGGANLRNTWLDKTTLLNSAALDRAFLDQLSFDGTNLATVKWDAVTMLGDEVEARTTKRNNGARKRRRERLGEYGAAVRAHLRLAAVLRSQGMSEQADRFTYRAKKLQRRILRLRRRYGSALGSWLLDLVSGHGFKPGRSFITYLLVILVFAAAFFALGTGILGIGGHDAINSPVAALVFSVTSFHGRGFFPGGGLALDDPITILAAIEAVMGLFIEITFIATFTQRFFAR